MNSQGCSIPSKKNFICSTQKVSEMRTSPSCQGPACRVANQPALLSTTTRPQPPSPSPTRLSVTTPQTTSTSPTPVSSPSEAVPIKGLPVLPSITTKDNPQKVHDAFLKYLNEVGLGKYFLKEYTWNGKKVTGTRSWREFKGDIPKINAELKEKYSFDDDELKGLYKSIFNYQYELDYDYNIIPMRRQIDFDYNDIGIKCTHLLNSLKGNN